MRHAFSVRHAQERVDQGDAQDGGQQDGSDEERQPKLQEAESVLIYARQRARRFYARKHV